jgi:uncharacterized membrane protein YecN with MAPEG domain
MPTITSLYAGILGLILIGVAFPAGMLRGRLNISIGDGGNPNLLLAMRRHANFVEWVPVALILIGSLELDHVRPAAIHTLGAALVFARLTHAIGLKADTMKSATRVVGAMLTMLIVLTSSVWLILLHI